MPAYSYPLFDRENHLFVELPEGVFLLDTGSPTSFGNTGSITFAGEKTALPESFGHVDMSAIRNLVVGPCNGLIGMNLLGNHPVRYSYKSRVLSVGENALLERGIKVASSSLMGVPMIGIQSRGSNFRTLFDTGAPYGYVMNQSLVNGLETTGSIHDYNPMLGEIDCPSYAFPYQLIDENGQTIGPEMCETVGFLGAGLAGDMLGMLGAEALIGWHLLENVDVLIVSAGDIEMIV